MKKEAFNKYSARFLEVIDAIGLRDYEIRTKIGMSQQYFYQLRIGKCGVPEKALVLLLENYPNVDANYIMTGRGSMTKDGSLDVVEFKDDYEDQVIEIKELLNAIEKKDERINVLTYKLTEL